MAKYQTGDALPKFKGYALVGPPWEVKQEFTEQQGDWSGGRVSACITGKIIEALPTPIFSYKRDEQHVMPDAAVGHTVAFFPAHPRLNHVAGDDVESYVYKPTWWGDFGDPSPDYALEWMLSRAGASTLGLDAGEDTNRCLDQITALMNTAPPFPVGIWDSRISDLAYQIPADTEVLARFYRFLYWDPRRQRPTWVSYMKEGDNGPYVTREVSFLLRVEAPEEYAGVIMRLPVNYTIRRAIDEGGESLWHQHPSAHWSRVMRDLGVEPADFAETVSDDLLFEVEVGGTPNWLGPLEKALQEASKNNFVHIQTTTKRLKVTDCRKALPLIVETLTGQKAFAAPTLRSAKELSDEELQEHSGRKHEEEEEPIPGFDPPTPATPTTLASDIFSRDEALQAINDLAGFVVWKAAGDAPSEKGLVFAQTYLVPLYAVVGLDKESALSGWTSQILADVHFLMADLTFEAACTKGYAEGKNFDAAVAYGKSLLESSKKAKDANIAF